ILVYLYYTTLSNKRGAFHTLTGFLTAVQQIQDDLDISEWIFDRVDFAFDTTLKYDDIFKYSLYIICLLSKVTGIENAINIQDVNTKKKRALTLKNSAFEFQIYDKALESQNKHPYSRFEFRFKRIRHTDIYALTERLQQYLNCLTDYIQEVENQRIYDLYAIWEQESKTECTTQIKNFSEFVRRYSDDIFTRDIAKGLHAKICNGNFDSWLKWFKRNNRIQFITQSDIKTIVQKMKKALNLYIQKE
ncbi:MAG: hypothetical protein ACI4JM_13285, partial [Oscillospiraceae bacterium]